MQCGICVARCGFGLVWSGGGGCSIVHFKCGLVMDMMDPTKWMAKIEKSINGALTCNLVCSQADRCAVVGTDYASAGAWWSHQSWVSSPVVTQGSSQNLTYFC